MSRLVPKPPEETPELAWADKWLQRLITYLGLPATILAVIFNQTYLAIICAVWLAAAVGYAIVKHLRKERTETLQLSVAPTDAGMQLAIKHPGIGTQDKVRSRSDSPEINILPIHGLGIAHRPGLVRITNKKRFQFADSFKVFRKKYLGKMSVIATFENQIDPPRRIESAGLVRAQIIFCNNLLPEGKLFEMFRVTKGCWIGDEIAAPIFGVNDTRHLLIAAAPFDVVLPAFMNIYEYSEELDKPVLQDFKLGIGMDVVVRIRLIPESHNELTVDFDYDLKITSDGGSFGMSFGPHKESPSS